VLVENKLHGLSPVLSEAIQSISRWELVQAALPHVLHCTAILLSNRNKLGKHTRTQTHACMHRHAHRHAYSNTYRNTVIQTGIQ
jgi:hypothetical protein